MRLAAAGAMGAALNFASWPQAHATQSKKAVGTAQHRAPAVKKAAAAKTSPSKRAVATKPAPRRTASTAARGSAKTAKRAATRTAARRRAPAPRAQTASLRARSAPRLSFGHQAGLQRTTDPLDLASAAALVVDQDTREVLLRKNARAVLPIASLTKLMTGVVISGAQLPLDERITISVDDMDTLKNSNSRLAVGTTLTRGELMHLALMSSENRAAHALARTFPGGLDRFVALMNAQAQAFGMTDTHYVEPTGLSRDNRSTAHDLALLVAAAYRDPLLRRWTTSTGYEIAAANGRLLEYHNSNGLIRRDSDWDIGIQKTGYIWEAGHCLALQATLNGRRVIMVFLDSSGRYTRVEDAERVRHWLERASVAGAPAYPLGRI